MYIFAVHRPVYLGYLWSLAYPVLWLVTLLCILVTLVTWLPCAYPLRCVKRFLGLVLTGSAEGFSLADKAINSATKSGR